MMRPVAGVAAVGFAPVSDSGSPAPRFVSDNLG